MGNRRTANVRSVGYSGQLINTPLDTLSYSLAFSPFLLIVLTLLYTRGLEIHVVVLHVMAP